MTRALLLRADPPLRFAHYRRWILVTDRDLRVGDYILDTRPITA